MAEKGFYTPTDLDMLRMENELLALENRFLKSQLAGEPNGVVGASAERLSYLEQAEGDLRWLLVRMGGSPVAWLFRLKRGFRALEERYL